MNTLGIISIIVSILVPLGGIVAIYVNMRISIAKIQVELIELRRDLTDKEIAILKIERDNRNDSKENKRDHEIIIDKIDKLVDKVLR